MLFVDLQCYLFAIWSRCRRWQCCCMRSCARDIEFQYSSAQYICRTNRVEKKTEICIYTGIFDSEQRYSRFCFESNESCGASHVVTESRTNPTHILVCIIIIYSINSFQNEHLTVKRKKYRWAMAIYSMQRYSIVSEVKP